MKIKLYLVGLSFLGCISIVCGQNITKRTLFLGNSYTASNNLPQMIDNVANSIPALRSLPTSEQTQKPLTLQIISTHFFVPSAL